MGPRQPEPVAGPQVVGSVSSIQLARYDVDTIELVRESFERWTKESSRPGRPVSFDFVEVSFEHVRDEAQRKKLNQVGTNFHISDEQVDLLIAAARQMSARVAGLPVLPRAQPQPGRPLGSAMR